jgi:Nicotinamide mononucleotide transporter
MDVSTYIERLEAYARRPVVNLTIAVVFVIVDAVGYRYLGGRTFVQSWGGSLAAVIATWFLIWKTQGYWFWMMVNAALWVALFFSMGLPLLAWLQVSFLIFCLYGMAQWALVKWRIGFNPRVSTDVVGTVIAIVIFAYSVYAYWNMPGYTGTFWWAMEAGTVLLAIAAIWMDAFRYKANWFAWTASNILSWPLFWHTNLWGPFFVTFVYQAMNVVGYYHWAREERAQWRLEAVTVNA